MKGRSVGRASAAGTRAIVVLAIARCCLVSQVWAQQADLVTTPAPNIMIGNYDSAPVGPVRRARGIGLRRAHQRSLGGVVQPGRAHAPGRAADQRQCRRVSAHRRRAWTRCPAKVARTSSCRISSASRSSPAPDITVGSGVPVHQRMGAGDGRPSDHAGDRAASTGSSLLRECTNTRCAWPQSASGITGGGPWRFGGGLALSMMSLGMAQSVSDRLADAATLRTLLVEAHASGSAYQIRAQGGVQFDLGEQMAVRRRACARLARWSYKSGSVVLEGLFAGPSCRRRGPRCSRPRRSCSFACHGNSRPAPHSLTPRFEIELDVQAYTPIDRLLACCRRANRWSAVCRRRRRAAGDHRRARRPA